MRFLQGGFNCENIFTRIRIGNKETFIRYAMMIIGNLPSKVDPGEIKKQDSAHECNPNKNVCKMVKWSDWNSAKNLFALFEIPWYW